MARRRRPSRWPRRLPSSRVVGASGNVPMFGSDQLVYLDFESLGRELDLKAAGTYAYATTADAIVCAYAVGHGPAQSWHAGGAILDWDYAPSDLRAAYDRGTFAAWNASFDRAIWNFSTLGFPFL